MASASYLGDNLDPIVISSDDDYDDFKETQSCQNKTASLTVNRQMTKYDHIIKGNG